MPEVREPVPHPRELFTVHSFDVDPDGLLAPRVLCAFLQEAAGRDAARRGVGMDELIARGFAWVLQRLIVAVDEWPREGAVVAVSTWPTRLGGATAERDFIAEGADGRPLARATSRWAVADLAARRAVRLPEFLRGLPVAEPGAGLSLPPFVARAADAALLGERVVEVRRGDLDLVGHANNTRFIEWGLEAVPDEWLKTRALAGLDVVYRQEALKGAAVASRAFAAGGDALLSHELLLASSGKPLADLVTRWRPRY